MDLLSLNLAIFDHPTQIWPLLLLRLGFLWVSMQVFGTDILWHAYLSLQTMTKCNQSWLICNQHRRNQHVYLTDLSSLNLSTRFLVLPPNCKCLWAWKMYMLSGWDGPTTGEGGLAAQTCWFCLLFTHFQWLIPEESEDTSTAWYLWHCQLLLSPHCHGFMFHSTCLS